MVTFSQLKVLLINNSSVLTKQQRKQPKPDCLLSPLCVHPVMVRFDHVVVIRVAVCDSAHLIYTPIDQ